MNIGQFFNTKLSVTVSGRDSPLFLSLLLILLYLLGLSSLFGRRLVGFPFQGSRVNLAASRPRPALLDVDVDDVLLLENDVMAFPVLDHAQVLKGAHNVIRVDSHVVTESLNKTTMKTPVINSTIIVTYLDRDLPFRIVANVLQKDVLPIGSVSHQSKIRQGFFRTPNLALGSRQQI